MYFLLSQMTFSFLRSPLLCFHLRSLFLRSPLLCFLFLWDALLWFLFLQRTFGCFLIFSSWAFSSLRSCTTFSQHHQFFDKLLNYVLHMGILFKFRCYHFWNITKKWSQNEIFWYLCSMGKMRRSVYSALVIKLTTKKNVHNFEVTERLPPSQFENLNCYRSNNL